jgi:hypothetical protein
MPDIQICGERDFSAYDSMSDEDLENLLRDDFSKLEGEKSDTDMLLYITEVLAKRRKERKEGKSPAEAWESFEQNYYTENDDFCISESVPASQNRGRGRWKWGLVATAAVLMLVIGTSVTAKAFKFDLWGTFAKWTKETFYFSSSDQPDISAAPNRSDIREYTGLQEVLAEYNISTALAPTWLPEGYEEVSIRTYETPERRNFVAQYKNKDNSIRIRISNYLNSDPSQIEQSDSLVEIYRSDGIDYYIFRNYDQLRAAWINGNYECVIMGPLSMSEIKEMIDSIGKG